MIRQDGQGFKPDFKTVDCVDWNLKVNLATHPIGTTEERDGGLNEVMPQVGGQRDQQNFNFNVLQKEEDGAARKKSFEGIYASNWWGTNDNGDPSSGVGSNTKNTRYMINILHSVVDKVKTLLGKDQVTFLDSSCGDMFWMPEFLRNRSDVTFTGYDITQSNIDSHKQRFSHESWTFKVILIILVFK